MPPGEGLIDPYLDLLECTIASHKCVLLRGETRVTPPPMTVRPTHFLTPHSPG